MAAHRPACPDVGAHDAFPADVRGMNFYVLMDAFYRRYGEPDQEPSLRTEPAQEVALFKSDASIAFPGSDLTSLTRSNAGQFTLTTKFLGFSGSQSPLPGYYLDRMARESAQNEEGWQHFSICSATAGRSLRTMPGANTAITSVFATAVRMCFHSACMRWWGWAIKACAINWPSTTARCWPTPVSWQRRGARRM